MFRRIKGSFSKASPDLEDREQSYISRDEKHKKDYILRLNPLNRGDIYLHRFRVKAPLGRGGYSEVYLVHDTKQKRDVVLKLYRLAGQLEHVKAYIERDSTISQRFVHDPIEGLITNYEVGKLPNGYGLYICQEYVENSSSLHDRLESENMLEPLTAITIAIKICLTLEQLHRRGVFHCDVKPLNILMTPANAPILIDLGAARLNGESVPEYPVVSVPYSSYEMINGEVADNRADIYALGMTLLHMIVGLPDWVESLGEYKDYTTAAVTSLLLQKHPTPEQLKDYTYKALLNVPSSDLASFISKAIQINPNDRYQSITEFKQDLLDYLRSHQVPTQSAPTASPVKPVDPHIDRYSAIVRFLVYRLQFAVDLAELESLCFDLSIPYEHIMPPNATLPERIVAAVRYMQRHGRLSEIVTWIGSNRPHLGMEELITAWLKDGRPSDIEGVLHVATPKSPRRK